MDHEEKWENPPLHSIEAEMSALGSCFYGAKYAEAVFTTLAPEDFFLDRHRIIAEAVSDMADAWEPVDLITTKNRLLSDGTLEEAGGEDYLIRLMECVPSPANASYYAGLVREFAWKRDRQERLLKAYYSCSRGDLSTAEIQALCDEAASSGGHALRGRGISISDIDVSEADSGVSTGFVGVDSMIGTEGYPVRQLTIVSAYQKGGKTAFMTDSATKIARSEKRVAYVTTADLDARQLKRRIMRQLTGWKKRPDYPGPMQDSWDFAVREIDSLDFKIYDATASDDGADVESICAWARSEHSRKPLDVMFADYAQKITTTDRKATSMVAEQEIVCGKLARLARRLGIPIVVGSQITEGGKEGRDRTKYGRVWEEDGGWILRLKIDGGEGIIETAYSRFGPPGSLRMRWDPMNVRFTETYA